jgi:hypothetical protein
VRCATCGTGATFYFTSYDEGFINANFHPAVWMELPFAALTKTLGISRLLADELRIMRSQGVSFERIAGARNERVANR